MYNKALCHLGQGACPSVPVEDLEAIRASRNRRVINFRLQESPRSLPGFLCLPKGHVFFSIQDRFLCQ